MLNTWRAANLSWVHKIRPQRRRGKGGLNPSRDKNLIKIKGMYRSGKGVWPFYCCDPGWSVFINISRDIFSRKQYMGDVDDDDDDVQQTTSRIGHRIK